MRLHQSCNVDDRDGMISFYEEGTLHELFRLPNADKHIRKSLRKVPCLGCRHPAALSHFTESEQGYNPIASALHQGPQTMASID